jgi:hypothetical protein
MANTRKLHRKKEERNEKTCLNCGAALYGRYCHECGQENIEQKQPIGRIILDFLDGLIYFDSKFFKTLKPLLIRPGFLVKEYISGKRTQYLSPLKMYFFLSFVFFLLQFSIDTGGEDDGLLMVRGHNDTVTTQRSETIFEYDFDSVVTIQQYDSVQNTLKPEDRDNVFRSWFRRKVIKKMDRSRNNPAAITKALNNKFYSNIPQLVFLLMPVVALLLKLLYYKKKIYLIDHLICSLNLHCFVFLFLILLTPLDFVDIELVNDIEILLFLAIIIVYITVALRNVYNQSWAKTIIKVFAILVLYTILISVSLIINGFLTFMLI